MAEFLLEAKTRPVDKQSQLTTIRDNDQVPGIVYGLKEKPQALTVGYNDLLKVLSQAGTSQIIHLKFDDQDVHAIVRDYQQDPVSEKVIHVDFLAVADDQPIVTKVPLQFVGISKGVKEKGGKLDIKISHVKVKCLPADLPSAIAVDISHLENINQSILAKDLITSDKVVVLNNPNDPVVLVIIPKKLETQAEEAAAQAMASEASAASAAAKPAEGEAETAKPTGKEEAKPAKA